MQDSERGPGADWDWLNAPSAEPGSKPDADADPEPCAEREPAQRWSAEEKARIVRESFWPGQGVSEVARRYGLSRKQLSAWRTLARKGKLALPSSAGPEPEPVAAACEPEPEPAFATLEVAPSLQPETGLVGSVSIEARGVTVRLDGDIGAGRIAEIASVLRALR